MLFCFKDIFQNVIYVRTFSHQLCCITINITLSNKKSKVTFFLEDPVPLWLYNIESYKPCTDQILICWFKYQHQWAIPASTVTNTTKAGQYTPVLMPITILMGNTCRSIVTDTTKDEQYTPLLILKPPISLSSHLISIYLQYLPSIYIYSICNCGERI